MAQGMIHSFSFSTLASAHDTSAAATMNGSSAIWTASASHTRATAAHATEMHTPTYLATAAHITNPCREGRSTLSRVLGDAPTLPALSFIPTTRASTAQLVSYFMTWPSVSAATLPLSPPTTASISTADGNCYHAHDPHAHIHFGRAHSETMSDDLVLDMVASNGGCDAYFNPIDRRALLSPIPYQPAISDQEASELYMRSGMGTPVMCANDADYDDCMSYCGTDTSLGTLDPSVFEMDCATLRAPSPTSPMDAEAERVESESDIFMSMAGSHSTDAFDAQEDDDPALPSYRHQNNARDQEAIILYLLSGARTPLMCTGIVDDDDCPSYCGTDTSLGTLNPSVFEMDGATLRAPSPTSLMDAEADKQLGMFGSQSDSEALIDPLAFVDEKVPRRKGWAVWGGLLARMGRGRAPDHQQTGRRFASNRLKATVKSLFGLPRVGASQ